MNEVNKQDKDLEDHAGRACRRWWRQVSTCAAEVANMTNRENAPVLIKDRNEARDVVYAAG
jgi:hypothetical protein